MELNSEFNKIVNRYHEKKMAHAFLIETNNMDMCVKEVLEVVKRICIMDEEDANISQLIDNNSLPSLMIIEPDGATIKKSQILELKERFLSKPIITKNNIYILKNSEKLNVASANTMLKFLEEPSGQVIGFFLTTNKKSMLSTIISRCQYLKINYKNDNNHEKYSVTYEEYNSYLDIISEYLKVIELKKDYGILVNKQLVLKVFDDRQKVEYFFLLLLEIYNSLYSKQLNLEFDIILLDKFDFLDLSLNQILSRMKLVSELLNDQVYNVNLDLLLDKFSIEMRRIDD